MEKETQGSTLFIGELQVKLLPPDLAHCQAFSLM